MPFGFPSDSKRVLDGIREIACPPFINDPTTVHKEKTYAPLSLIIDLSGGSQNASLAVYKRGESLRIGTLSLMYVGVQMSKVVSVTTGTGLDISVRS